MNILSGLLRYALKRKLVPHNVVRDLDRDDRPGVARQSEPRYLSEAELTRLFAEMTDTFRPVALVCAYAGLRISETLGLRWADLDLASGTLTVNGQLGENGERLSTTRTRASAATMQAPPALVRELRAHRARQASRSLALVRSDALVFTTANGKPQSRRNALRAIHIAGDAAGLNGEGVRPIGLHDLRHSLVAIAFRARPDAARGRAARPSCEPARHGDRLRRADDRRPRAGSGETRRGRIRRLNPCPQCPQRASDRGRRRPAARNRMVRFAGKCGRARTSADAPAVSASWGSPVRARHAPSSETQRPSRFLTSRRPEEPVRCCLRVASR